MKPNIINQYYFKLISFIYQYKELKICIMIKCFYHNKYTIYIIYSIYISLYKYFIISLESLCIINYKNSLSTDILKITFRRSEKGCVLHLLNKMVKRYHENKTGLNFIDIYIYFFFHYFIHRIHHINHIHII